MIQRDLTKPLSSLLFLSVKVTTIVVLLARKTLCADSRFLACSNSITCGDGPIISFPFYIQDVQESYCGNPGFSISCKNNKPILRLSNNDYTIHQIFYDNHAIHVSNTANFNTSTSCNTIPPIHNLSLPSDRFMFSPSYTFANLLLLYRCNSMFLNSTNLLKYKVDCPGDMSNSTIAIFEDDPLIKDASESCEKGVVAPVLKESYRVDQGGIKAIEEMLQRGFVLNWIAHDCYDCRQSGGKCGFNESLFSFRCFCPDRPHRVRCPYSSGSGKSKSGTLAGIAIASSFAGIVLISVYCFWRKLFCWNKKCQNHEMIEAVLRNQRLLALKRYRYSQVKKITKTFQEKLGKGGYGSVFKGKLPHGRLVAVKVLKESKSNGEEFINEVASISRTSHVNIVTLLGFCFEGSKQALIYEFMPNGSLEKYIYNERIGKDDRQLGWETLYQIAVGIAQGLEYLHRGCNTRILHFDIKPHNILLDENFCPKISDFGLSKVCTTNDSIVSMLGARGTAGYIAPEVFCRNIGGVSHKSDVYSYGMMVLEMVGGRKNICVEVDNTSEIYFPHWIYNRIELGMELGLLGIKNDEENQLARKMIMASLWCIQTDPSNRPQMCRVVEMLQACPVSLPVPPRPYLSSPSRSPKAPFTDSSVLLA